MTTLPKLASALAVLFLVACNRPAPQPASQTSTPASPPAKQVQSKAPPADVSISIEKKAVGGLEARFIEASAPPTVKLSKVTPPGSFAASEPERDEPAPTGMKWLAITVEFEPTQGEVATPMSRIRLLDESKRKYRLVSIGGSATTAFIDFRDYDNYRMVQPPKLVVNSPARSRDTLLFAVPSDAKRLSLAF